MFDINIVIVNYKMKEDIAKCLTSLFVEAAGDNLHFNIVVVDNASADSINEMLKNKFPGVKLINQTKNTGFGKAQNAGLSSVEAKYHFVLNPDTVFKPGQHALKRLYGFMELHPKIGMIGPKMVYPNGILQYSCYRFPTFWQPLFSRTDWWQEGKGKKNRDKFLMKEFDHNKIQPVDWLMGSAMFLRGDAMKQAGLFDERFWMYCEDSDLCRRFWEAGWPVYYFSEVVLAHNHGRGSAKVPGIINAVLKNKLARVHIFSWLKYMWKWRGNYKYYAGKYS